MKSLTPKGARNSDVFPRCGVPPPILSHPSVRPSSTPISPGSPWINFANEVIQCLKGQRKQGEGPSPIPGHTGEAGRVHVLPIPRGWVLGTAPRSHVPPDGATTPARKAWVNAGQICAKAFANTETVWMVTGQGTRPCVGHARLLVAMEQRDLPIPTSWCQVSAWLVRHRV